MNYKLTQRKGRSVQVSFDNGKTWKSTGCNSKAEAIRRLELNKNGGSIRFKDFVDGFFINTDSYSYRHRQESHGKKTVERTYLDKQAIIDNYLIQAFGNYSLSEITPVMIDDWLISDTGNRKGRSKNSFLTVLRQIFDKAVYDGLINTNPASSVKRLLVPIEKQKPLSLEECEKLCPNTSDNAIEIWGRIELACIIYIMRDTGFRPSEVLAISIDNFDFKNNTVFTESHYNVSTKRVETRIKTTNSGKKYKVGIISDITKELVYKLILSKTADEQSDYIFLFKGIGYDYESWLIKTIRRITRRELGRDDITPKSFRHLFMTNLIGKMPKDVIMELMGHTKWEECYDDRTKEMIIEQALDMLKKYQSIS